MGMGSTPSFPNGVGDLAFPSASEPNPLARGLRGSGQEIIYGPPGPPQTTPPTAPPPINAAPPPAQNTATIASMLGFNPMLLYPGSASYGSPLIPANMGSVTNLPGNTGLEWLDPSKANILGVGNYTGSLFKFQNPIPYSPNFNVGNVLSSIQNKMPSGTTPMNFQPFQISY